MGRMLTASGNRWLQGWTPCPGCRTEQVLLAGSLKVGVLCCAGAHGMRLRQTLLGALG
jgi:hypothetical protein